jgi:hypothetical protein
MNLRTLKKLSKRAAPYLPFWGTIVSNSGQSAAIITMAWLSRRESTGSGCDAILAS